MARPKAETSRENGRKGGRPKGTTGILHKATIDKALYRESLRQLVVARLQPMVEAQMAAAEGIKYLVTRDKKTGKFTRVTEAMMRELEGSDDERVEVWEKDPSTPAFADLLNRALDKPMEHIEHSGDAIGGGPVFIMPAGTKVDIE